MRAIPLYGRDDILLMLDGTTVTTDIADGQPVVDITSSGQMIISCQEAAELVKEIQWALKACSPDPLSPTEAAELQAELEKKLPARGIDVDVHSRVVQYYDYYGVTFRQIDAEERCVREYLTNVVSQKVGRRIVITEDGHSGNGHLWFNFEYTDEDKK